MNAYLFTAGITQSQVRASPGRFGRPPGGLETWDSCMSLVLYGGSPDEAQNRFEKWLSSAPDEGNPVQLEIKRIITAPVVDQLFTEYGHEPIDWPQISEKADASLKAADVDDFEQGYWADVNQLVPADKLTADMESLRRELPEEIRSGLNWSSDKIFFFLVSVLSLRVSPTHILPVGETINLRTGEIRRADSQEEKLRKSNDEKAMFPQLVDKKAAALVQARNSVVAAWLWRKFTAEKGLPADEIRIDPWCGAISTRSDFEA